MQSADCVPCSLQTGYLAPCSLQTAQVFRLHATYLNVDNTEQKKPVIRIAGSSRGGGGGN